MGKLPDLSQIQAQDLLARGSVVRVERKLTYRLIDGWMHCVPENTTPDVLLIDVNDRILGRIKATAKANQSGR